MKMIGGNKTMVQKSRVQQDTIVCQVCEKVIDTAYSSEGVKVLYGICQRCLGSGDQKAE
ncbi:GapA-binding peptide SR1P [Bacillus stercoris]|uniref:GapA-binding peptide SR1P n=1 Tax=Bacillus stercoris TaxID=2054641 RepID=UPI004045441B